MSAASKKKTSIIPARCVWGHICSLSSIDQDRNNISLFNIIEQINIPHDVFVLQKKEKKSILIPCIHEVVLLWSRIIDIDALNEEFQFDFKLKVRDPNEVVVRETLATVVFAKNIKRTRFRIIVDALVITIPGNYLYEVDVKKTEGGDFQRTLNIPFEVAESKIKG